MCYDVIIIKTPIYTVFGRSVKDGAATTINAAVNPTLNSQQAVYYSDCQPKVSSADSRFTPLSSMSYKVYGRHTLACIGMSSIRRSCGREALTT